MDGEKMSTHSITFLDHISHLLSNLSLTSSLSNASDSPSTSEYILLLTPYLHTQPLHLEHITEPADPFESFGRSLSSRHTNIRHSPYVAAYGITELHKCLLDQAKGIIIVLCSAPKMKHVRLNQRLDGLMDQERFAKAISKHMIDELKMSVLRILVTIDVGTNIDEEYYDAVFNLKNWDELEKAANTLLNEN
jgi:hypothetical protein